MYWGTRVCKVFLASVNFTSEKSIASCVITLLCVVLVSIDFRITRIGTLSLLSTDDNSLLFSGFRVAIVSYFTRRN